MSDELHPDHTPGSVPGSDATLEPDELAGHPMIARMRSALDEAARVEPGTAKPTVAPDRRRWLAVAAAAVLVAGGVAALAVNLSRERGTISGPVPGPATLLTGQATIIDMGQGPKLAVTLAASLPPQGGDIPLAGFDWSMVDDEQTVNGTTWTDSFLQITGTWDGSTFTITTPPTPAVTSTPTSTPVDQNCPDGTAQAAADAVSALDWQALHLTEWYPQQREGVCGAHVGAWFDTPELRAALDGIRAAGHDLQVAYVFNPAPTDVTDPTSTTGLPSGGAGGWYEIAAPGFTPRPPEFTVCCPPMPAPGPDTVMAWVGDDGSAILMLRAVGHLDGSTPELQFTHFGMTDDRAKELEAKVQPGSGLPYVLDDPSMTLLAQGLGGVGASVSQRYIPTTGDGDVLLTVGDYTGQLEPIATANGVTALTIAGQAGLRYRTDAGATGSTVYVWQTPDKTWAELRIGNPLADRADEIVASLVPAPLPSESTPTTTVPGPSVPEGSGTQITGWSGTALAPYVANLDSGYVGTMVPTFTVGVGAQAVSVDAATNGARPTVFVFYAEWSPHSKLLVETLVKAYAAGELPPATQLVLVRSADGGGSRLFNADDITGWGYAGPIYFDLDTGDGSPGTVATAFGATGYPFMVVAGPDGTLQRRASGELEPDALTDFVAGTPTDTGLHLSAPGTDFDVIVNYDQYGVGGWFVMTDAPDPFTATPTNTAVIAASADRNSSVASPDWKIGQQVVYTDGKQSRTFVVVGWKRGHDGSINGTQDGAAVIVSYEGTSDVPWEGYLAPALPSPATSPSRRT